MQPAMFTFNQYPFPEEIWAPITTNVVENILPYYEISTYGRVRSNSLTGSRDNYISFFMNGKRNYFKFRVYINDRKSNGKLMSKDVYVHRIALATFFPIYGWENLDVNHIDGDCNNNCIWNLEWCTNLENIQKSVDIGLCINRSYERGEYRYNNKYPEDMINKICYFIDCGYTKNQIIKEIYKYYPSFSNIDDLVKGIMRCRYWRSVSINYNFPIKRMNNELNDDMWKIVNIIYDYPYMSSSQVLNLFTNMPISQLNPEWRKRMIFYINSLKTHMSMNFLS